MKLLLVALLTVTSASAQYQGGGQLGSRPGGGYSSAGFPGGAPVYVSVPGGEGAYFGQGTQGQQNYQDSQRGPVQFLPSPATKGTTSNNAAARLPAILLHKQALGQDGSFNFAFQADNGLQQGERIEPDGTRKGSYSYVGPDGQPITVRYTAGKNGFVAEGDHLPRQPTPFIPSSTGPQRSQPTQVSQAYPVGFSTTPSPAIIQRYPSSLGQGQDDDGSVSRYILGQGTAGGLDLRGTQFSSQQPVYSYQQSPGGAVPLGSPTGAYSPQASLGAGAYSPQSSLGAGAYNPQLSLGAGAYSSQPSLGVRAYPSQPSLSSGAYSTQPSLGTGAYSSQPSLGAGAYASQSSIGAGQHSSQPSLSAIAYSPQVAAGDATGAYSPHLSIGGADGSYSPQFQLVGASGTYNPQSPLSGAGSAYSTQSPLGGSPGAYNFQLPFGGANVDFNPQLSFGGSGASYAPQLASAGAYAPQVQLGSSNGAYTPQLSLEGADGAYPSQFTAGGGRGATVSPGGRAGSTSAYNHSPVRHSAPVTPLPKTLYRSSTSRPSNDDDDYQEPNSNKPHNFGPGYSFEFSG